MRYTITQDEYDSLVTMAHTYQADVYKQAYARFPMVNKDVMWKVCFSIRNPRYKYNIQSFIGENVNDRLTEKALRHKVIPDGLYDGDYLVTSGTSGKTYRVACLVGGGYGCDCAYGKENWGKRCSHILAVEMYIAAYPKTAHTVYANENSTRFVVESSETGELYRVLYHGNGCYGCTCVRENDCAHIDAVKKWFRRAAASAEQTYVITVQGGKVIAAERDYGD